MVQGISAAYDLHYFLTDNLNSTTKTTSRMERFPRSIILPREGNRKPNEDISNKIFSDVEIVNGIFEGKMGIVQVFVRALQLSPPTTKTRGSLPKLEVGIQHDPVNAFVCAVQKVGIARTEFVNHDLCSNFLLDQDDLSLMKIALFVNCPVGATSSGRSPGRGVATINGLTVVVRAVQLSNGIIQITDAWVKTVK